METTGSIVLSKLQIENDEYQIISSAEDIIRFKEKTETGEEVYKTSPELLTIRIYKNKESVQNGDSQSQPIDFQNNYGFYSINSGEATINDYVNYTTVSEEKDYFLVFKIQELINTNSFCQDNDDVFVFEYIINNKVVTSKAFQLRDGVGPEMAKFSVTATMINSSVGDSKMVFTENGLEIKNGQFEIYQDNNMVFGIDSNNNKLTMKGVIEAEGGSFSGQLCAPQGTIGGFEIKEGKLISSNVYYVKTKDTSFQEGKEYYDAPSGSIGYQKTDDEVFILGKTYYEKINSLVVDGTEGNIYAKKITLGEEAAIENKIQLGTDEKQAEICNPLENNGCFIKSGKDDIIIKNDGTARFGKIEIDGKASKISGKGWSINETAANFNNINVSGAIETVVFKTNSVQAAGGAMIFRPSYKGKVISIPSAQNIHLELEDPYTGGIGNRIQIIKNNNFNDNWIGFVSEIENEGRKLILEFNSQFDLLENDNIIIIDYGSNKDLIIGINSGNTSVGYNEGILPRGLTLTELDEDNRQTIKTYLGDLSNLSNLGLSGYGLYSNNVHLTGSLTTQSEGGTYAGVNTSGGVTATFLETDTSNIVFWAGADSTDVEDIKEARFQVTERGSVYLQQGKIKGSLFSGGIIEAAELRTAKLQGQSSGLSIYDGSKGIQFKKEDVNGDIEIFSIKSDGLSSQNKSIISFLDNKISLIGDEIKTGEEGNYICLKTNKEKQGITTPVLYHYSGPNEYCGFYFEPNQTQFKIKDQTIQNWNREGVQINGRMEINTNNTNLQYKEEEGGYNLYVINKEVGENG